ncbi:Multi-sensor hybrid histidine kinase (fragment) [Candidatus Sulfopaludibacter sp. SbA3]
MAEELARSSISPEGGGAAAQLHDRLLSTLIGRLMEDAPIGFALYDTDFRYLVVNAKLAEKHRVPAAAHVGHTVKEIVPYLAAQLEQAFQMVMATGKPLLDVEFSGERSDTPGLLRHWSESWFPVHAADGRILGAGALVSEITAQKLAVEELRMSQKRLELMQAAGRIGSWEWDIQTRKVHCSLQYGPLYGLPPGRRAPHYEEWVGLVHPEDRERIQQEVSQALSYEDEHSSEFRVVWPDGTIHWLLGKTQVFRDAAGNAVRMLGVVMDITERKQAEVAIDNEQRFRSMADGAPVMICTSGPDSEATFFNKGWLCFTGRGMEHELGTGWTADVHPDDRQQVMNEIAASSEMRRYWQAEYRLRRADGEYRWVLGNGAPRFEADGRFAGYVASAIDITDLKRCHEGAEGRQKLESVGVVAGEIAHDLNNFLSSILSESELLDADLPDDSAAREGIARIKRVAGRAAGIVRELLAYEAEEKAVFQPVDLTTVVGEMLDLLKVSISKRARLEVDLPRNLAAVRANPSQIWQVVLNLVTNASESLGERGGTITVTAAPVRIVAEPLAGRQRASGAAAYRIEEATRSPLVTGDQSGPDDPSLPEGDYIRLEVSDTGCGMTGEVRARIFDRFFTTKFSGRGLGLAVVQGIIRRHGGTIRVQSTPGKGSRFEVLLPSIPEPAVRACELAERDADSQTVGGGGTILLVEDETSLRLPVSRMLQKKGYSVIEAGDGPAAAEAFRAHAKEIGVVLLDLTLPAMSGAEVLSALRALQPQVRVILTSAHSCEKALADAGGQQSWEFIRKPYCFTDLENLLQQALQEYDLTANGRRSGGASTRIIKEPYPTG